ncbi:uncharacterized protein LOC124841106 [Vigna umbellata]|uniref:uncharacterized protein LOC124841106 n=1 Tax=Vigna umbellata TaxID=87088 RepID=UPI001F5ED4AF|nr:uncharacterized protein LOC124841106 [Vigna umbellata]
MVFDICLHHMGKFVTNKGLQYVEGEIHVIKGLDPDRWSYFEAVGIVKEFKYDADFKLWWKGLKQRLVNNVRLLSDDREARDKPIITMMEWIRTYIMSRFATLREKTKTYTGVVMPKSQNRLDRGVEKSGNWIPTWTGAVKFEVTHGFTMDKFVVDLSNHSCSCYFWDLVGIPCRHVVAAINYKVENLEDYVHPYYKKKAYETCYGPKIVPINGQQLWSTSESGALLPPVYKTPLGRPKRLRRREADPYVSHTKLSKKNLVMKCSSCNKFGHNVRTCKRG